LNSQQEKAKQAGKDDLLGIQPSIHYFTVELGIVEKLCIYKHCYFLLPLKHILFSVENMLLILFLLYTLPDQWPFYSLW
jgi:hypothetical protein